MALLIYVAIAGSTSYVRRDRLVALFWPEHDQEHGRSALRKALHAIRQCLGREVFRVRGEELCIDHTVVRSDAAEFERAIARDELARAFELYRGSLLDGFFAPDSPGFERWVEGLRARYREEASRAAWTLAERYEKGSDLTSATRWARRAARLATHDERTLRRALQLLHRAGDRAGAMRLYDDFVAELQSDLEILPSPETVALIQRIRHT